MFGGFKASEIKQISSISKKLNLNTSKLPALLKARKEGKSEEEVMGQILDLPEGVDAKTYLRETLTPSEYEVLRGVIEKYTQGAGKDPLA